MLWHGSISSINWARVHAVDREGVSVEHDTQNDVTQIADLVVEATATFTNPVRNDDNIDEVAAVACWRLLF